ncbi:MAG: CapA family protein [Treponema sp.]|nr:CapA family protein [Treponema sp.]
MKRFYNITIKLAFSLLILTAFFMNSCASTENKESQEISEELSELYKEEQEIVSQEPELPKDSNTITLLFAGDIMAHSVNYSISDYPKIWRDVKYLIEPCDLSFANIEAPVDNTQKWQNYPNFNMPQSYIEAAVDTGFDIFSLCNNHTNDQGLNGIKETIKSAERLVKRSKERNEDIYFSGLKDGKDAAFSYNLIEKNGWKILFLPMTEILNRPSYSDYINYIDNSEKSRKEFIKYVKQLRQENPCDLMVLSIHAYEVEYTRNVTAAQEQYYMDLLDAGVDILWANHAHIIKDRKYIFYHETDSQKVIMYANGNTISGQRTAPDFNSSNPIGERDNTGDGLMVKLTFKKQKNGLPPRIIASENFFITTYINTANEYVVKPLNQNFIDYLWEIPRTNWAKYIQRRIEINNKYTKDYIVWQ